tara:strand:+ start:769 stop:1641 length:873 start_codon:yes stop_codon:yes gene_type:complete
MNYITHIILTILSVIFSTLPRSISISIGRQIGTLLYLFPFRKNVAKKNIKIAFKHLTQSDRKNILFNCYKHYGMVLVDFLCQQSIKEYNLDDYFVFQNDAKKNLLSANGGCILSAHIGNWELVLPAMGMNNIKMDTVVMEQKNKAADNFYTKLRTFKNIKLIPKNGALKSLYNAISENRMVGLASDQNARRQGKKINFFGELSSFPKGAGKFYCKTKCKLFIVFCILRSDLKYYIYTHEIKINRQDKSEDEIIELIISEYASILEEKIKQHPEQYFWFHKKWSKLIYKNG